MAARRVFEPVANDLRPLDGLAQERELLLGDVTQLIRCRAIRGGCPKQQTDLVQAEPGSLRGLDHGERLAFSFLFLFLGALPCTDWLGDAVARDDKGFILTGAAAGADTMLETSLPGVFAAGDVRSGSTKRCATAVGEGAMAVQFVHGRLAEHSRPQPAPIS